MGGGCSSGLPRQVELLALTSPRPTDAGPQGVGMLREETVPPRLSTCQVFARTMGLGTSRRAAEQSRCHTRDASVVGLSGFETPANTWKLAAAY
ncbi:protein of unknown function (plasmid) [Streptantibioticus cattleyicolor NRRL 8057 = DSM 46488]|nr:protein of unknown function [Streptantibioticus cattleyicolor NRRL 8057 = DSM 46488]